MVPEDGRRCTHWNLVHRGRVSFASTDVGTGRRTDGAGLSGKDDFDCECRRSQ